jgi:hypothetical protein
MTKLPDKQKIKKRKKDTERTAWHPAFQGAIELEFREYLYALEITAEYPLTSEPLKIDLLVVKKILDISLDKSIARIFKNHNILEYKSPNVSVSIDDYKKMQNYGWFYSWFIKGVDTRDVSLTMIITKYSRKLLNDLREVYGTESTSKGIYTIMNCDIKAQIVVIDELPEAENLWLTSLRENLTEAQLERVKNAKSKLSEKSSAVDAYFNVVFGANFQTYKQLDKSMKTLTQIAREAGIADIFIAEGREEERLKIEAKWYADKIERAGRLKLRGIDDKIIVEATGLPLREVKRLKPLARRNVSRKR